LPEEFDEYVKLGHHFAKESQRNARKDSNEQQEFVRRIYPMTAIEGPRTLVEREESDPSRNLELAAAEAQVRVAHLLRGALDRSRLSQKELAERVGVTEGRVSQVLNSDGNLRITTIARFLRALGYSFELAGKAADSEVQPLERPGPRRRKRTEEVHVYTAGESSQGGM